MKPFSLIESKGKFYLDGGEYDFNNYEFAAHFHPDFIEILCKCTLDVKIKKGTMDGYWRAIRRFLNLLYESKPELYYTFIPSSDKLTNYGTTLDWSFALQVYLRVSEDNISSYSQRIKAISGMNWWINRLAFLGFIPRIPSLPSPQKNPNQEKAQTIIDTEIPAHILDALSIKDKNELNQIQRLYAHVRYELMCDAQSSDVSLLDNIGAKSEWALENRLLKVRTQLERKFVEAMKIRCDGLKTVRKYRHLVPLVDKYLSFNGGSGYINPFKNDLISLGYDTYKSALLSWSWYKNDGIQLKNHDEKKYRDASKILNELRKKEGLDESYCWDDTWFSDRIGCNYKLYVPAILIIVFDNSANISPVRELGVNTLDYEFGIPVITWTKHRAHSNLFKHIDTELNISTEKIFKVIRCATKKYRSICADDQKQYLFLQNNSSAVYGERMTLPRNPTSNTLTNHMKDVLSGISGGDWYATGDMIRNSVLLLQALKGGVKVVQEEAQHSSTKVSTRYANRPAMKAKFHEHMLEYKEWLQTLITLQIEDAPKKLGIDPVAYEKNKAKILESRFGGLICSNPLEGVQKGTEKGKLCNKVAWCILCKNKKHVFIESVENITHLLQWQIALELAVKNKTISPKSVNWYFWFKFIEEMISRLTDTNINKARNEALLADAQDLVLVRNNPYLSIEFRDIT